ncbi:uncharacterized protein LOC129593939 [Paramacrobiotus metropolitanus]|uniref:uncharacterized protein LOC129593939 n=1 Tax=Paramacrobiotus metropolitanus TaxID=2943436 RepID=UPI0024457292|nr:uncharacterized protein LOC129593939 [Paramacrobiotus metropolitanus]
MEDILLTPESSDDLNAVDTPKANGRKTIEELVFEVFNVKKREKRKSSVRRQSVAEKDIAETPTKTDNVKKVTIVEPIVQQQQRRRTTRQANAEDISKGNEAVADLENGIQREAKHRKISLSRRDSKESITTAGLGRKKSSSLTLPKLTKQFRLMAEFTNRKLSETVGANSPEAVAKGHAIEIRQTEKMQTKRTSDSKQNEKYSFSQIQADKLLRQLRDSRTDFRELPSEWIKNVRSDDLFDVNAEEWAEMVTAGNDIPSSDPVDNKYANETEQNAVLSDKNGTEILVKIGRNDALPVVTAPQNQTAEKSHLDVQISAASGSLEKVLANPSADTITSWTTVSSLSSVGSGRFEEDINNAGANKNFPINSNNSREEIMYQTPSGRVTDARQIYQNSVDRNDIDNSQNTTKVQKAKANLEEPVTTLANISTQQSRSERIEKMENILQGVNPDTIDELHEVFLPLLRDNPTRQLDCVAYYESEADTLSCCSEKVTVRGEEAMEQRAWEIQMPEIFEMIRLNAGHVSEYALLNRNTLRAVAISRNLKASKAELVRLMRCLTQLMEAPRYLGKVVESSRDILVPFGNKLYKITQLDPMFAFGRTFAQDYEGFVARPVLGFFIVVFYATNSFVGVASDIVCSLVDYITFCVFGCLPEYEDGFDMVTTALDDEHWRNHKEDHESEAYRSRQQDNKFKCSSRPSADYDECDSRNSSTDDLSEWRRCNNSGCSGNCAFHWLH